MAEPKIVVVGWHRTGTTSLHAALEQLGYRVAGWSIDRGRLLMSGQTRPLWRDAKRFDAFRDFPWSLMYEEFTRRYPDARFILTNRDDESWMESYKRHDAIHHGAKFHRWLYGQEGPEGNEVDFISRFRRHNDAVRTQFYGTSRLLQMNIFEGDGWDKLCNFVASPVPEAPFPTELSRVVEDEPKISDREQLLRKVDPWLDRASRLLDRRIDA